MQCERLPAGHGDCDLLIAEEHFLEAAGAWLHHARDRRCLSSCSANPLGSTVEVLEDFVYNA